MRLIYMTQSCAPEPGATKRPLKIARALTQMGYDVTVVTAFPSYPLGKIAAPYRGKWYAREKVDGVEVIRVWCVPAPNRGTFRRVCGFVSFCTAAALAGLRLPRADVVLASVPKPFTEFAGWFVARWKGSLFAIDLRDLLPDTLEQIGLQKTTFLYRLLRKYYAWMYRRADLLAMVSAWMEPALLAYGVSAGRCVLLPHGVDFDQLPQDGRSLIRRELALDGSFVVAYAGSFSQYYRIPFLLKAARVLKSKRADVKFLLVGTGHDFARIEQAVASDQLNNVILTGGVQPDSVFGYLQAADVLVHPQWLPSLTEGTKILEYMAVGRPVINLCEHPRNQEAELLGIGISVAHGDTVGLTNAIARLGADENYRQRCGVTGQELVRTRYDRKQSIRRFTAALENLRPQPDTKPTNE